MISRNFYMQMVVRIVALALTAMVFSYLFFTKHYFPFALLLLLFVVQSVGMVRYVNHTNRKIAYFFDAIRNEDFTLRFPEKDLIKSFEKLNHSLNRVNELIQEVHLKKQEQEQFYQEILKQTTIGILTFNAKGHILFANPTMERLLNYSPLNHIKQLDQVDKKLYALFAQLKPFDRRLIQLTNERERRQLALKSTALTLNEQDLLLVVAHDIHKELEEKETDSWVRLIRVLTHEIMNTITPITSISGSILNYFKTEKGLVPVDSFGKSHVENTVKGLEVIKKQGTDLMEFVQSYRSLLNVPAPDKSIIKANALLNKVQILMAEEIAKNKLQFTVSCNPVDLEFYGDERQLTQVLVNLSKNALQALRDDANGRIAMVAGSTAQGEKYIELSDNGPGIPVELLDEIFVPFFTTKKEGTGIGLSLSKQIMHLHGGNLEVRSAPFQGTSFVLTF
ncbi:ATP-binding protein [Flavobacteriaceae bacterium 3-367]|uniref:sensor histidine kinase n=1 Tax=Eudoraea algarum TaxID=3417568 RepID=UPI003271D1D5